MAPLVLDLGSAQLLPICLGACAIHDSLTLPITCPQPWRDWLSGLLSPYKHAWLDWLMALLSPRKQAAADRPSLVGLSHETHPRLLQACPAQTSEGPPLR